MRVVLLVALVLAVPLRAYAGTAMQLCGPSHHEGLAAAAHAPDHDHADHQSGAHDVDSFAAEAPDAADASVCSACGACCLGAASMPPQSRADALFAAHSTPIPFIATPFAGVVLERVDRPPLPART